MKQRTSMGFLIISFFVCFIVGIVLANQCGVDHFEEYGSLTKYYLISYGEKSYDPIALLLYVCKSRCLHFVLLALSTFLFRKTFVLDLYGAWCGFTYGYFFVLTIGAFGSVGSLVALASIFPQVICYLMLFFGMRSRVTFKLPMKRSERVLEIVMLLLLFILGLLLEVYVNPWILQKVIRWI